MTATAALVVWVGVFPNASPHVEQARDGQQQAPDARQHRSQPLVTSIFTADPAAHVFGGRIYVYVSHDIDGPPLPDVEPFKNSHGNSFRMRDYRVLSMQRIGSEVTVHPVAHADLNATYGAPLAADRPTFFLGLRGPGQHVAYRAGNGHIMEILW